MAFSNRTPDDISPNPITKALEVMAGRELINLTQSNPTLCGFNYPQDILSGLTRPEALRYDPQAFGSLYARQILAGYLAQQGRVVDPQNLILTASTSEAYSYLFKLLGDPGDVFLTPTPGYPLLDHLLHLEGLRSLPYFFQVEPHWPVDQTALIATATPQIKALITVNPNNPTGAFLNDADEQTLLQFCEKHDLAYISDEVFANYAYAGQHPNQLTPKVLTFHLGGLSKSLGLPQLKLAWIEVSGPKDKVTECLERLELIADTYLSVNTPVQVGLEKLLAFAPNIQKQILTRVLANRQVLVKAFNDSKKVKVWPAQGGWYALLEVLGDKRTDEELVLQLIKKGLLVHPGGFYDVKGCFLVLSLLPQPELFQTGAACLKEFLA